MVLATGLRLGAYEITGQIGAGGMGEVYRASDTRLGRELAIKTLPAALAAEPERLTRFEREAKLLAALNHTNIASVHSLDEHEGTLYLAMELVEGETLEAKLEAGAMSIEEALELALQIAEALEAAHEKGVVHRDLKPANVMVAREGVVKVLDFGLAKAFSSPTNGPSPPHSPSLSLAMTQQGLVLGTAGYMSPEQASGQATDQRADVWAFGVVLYEMLTGMPVFSGESAPHIIAGILKSEPDWSRLPEHLHPRLRLLLERCLEKKPRNRLHSIADARIEIEAVLRDPRGIAASAVVEASRTSGSMRARWVTAALAGGLAALVLGAAVWYLEPAAPAQVVRFSEEVVLPSPQALTLQAVDISRDGARIAYNAGSNPLRQRIYVRNVDEAVARPVEGTWGAVGVPRFSPDGQWLAYFQAPPSLWRVPIGGGTPQRVVDDLRQPTAGIDWDDRGMLLYAQSEGIYEVPLTGGDPRLIVPARDGEELVSPRRLPGGDAVLFTVAGGTSGADRDAGEIAAYSPGSGERTVVWPGGRDARYLRSGHLVYAQGEALFAARFDLESLRVVGSPVRVVDGGIMGSSSGASASAQYAVSDTGSLVRVEAPGTAAASDSPPRRRLLWMSRDGVGQPIAVPIDHYSWARISPDGSRVALVVGDLLLNRMADIWILELETGNRRQLTFDLPADGPVWAPDGERIYFRHTRGAGLGAIYSVSAEGGAPELVAPHTPGFEYALPWSVSPDGETLALFNPASFTDSRIATLGTRPESEFRELLRDASGPAFSPNGSWMAYVEVVDPAVPTTRIAVRPYPDVARALRPVAGGQAPVFSHDGRELFYVADGALWAVPIQYEPSFRIGTPETLFRVPFPDGPEVASWDRHPDGERFLMIADADAQAGEAPTVPDSYRMRVVVNWLEELRQRVPVR